MTPATPAVPSSAPTSRFQLDRSVASLRERADAWLAVPLGRKIEYLRSLRRRTAETAAAVVRDAVAAKGGDRQFAGEDWVGGPTIQGRVLRILIDTLEGLDRTGRVPVAGRRIHRRPDGRLTIGVTPYDVWDRLLFPMMSGEVWLDPEIGIEDLDTAFGSIYTKPESAVPGVAVVLGAGNVASIASLDAVQKLFVEGKTTIVKLNPVNEYLGPHMERVFGDLIEDGFVRIAYGGAEVGTYLVHHPGTDLVHITGAADTHDTIVFGPGEGGRERKAHNVPLLDKPITSELGSVSPVIVAPGRWSGRDFRFQAEHIATQMTQNNGFNCVAAKVLVLPAGWAQKDAFLDHLRRVLAALPARRAYYPGSEQQWERFVDDHPGAEVFGDRLPGLTPPALIVGVDAGSDDPVFRREAFCALAATTELPGQDAGDFLARAVGFCNERLAGTLQATVLIDPATAREHGRALDRAVADLRYGSVTVNIWGAVAYGLGTTAWGGFPGPTADDIQSGVGFVHNGLLIDRPEKSVVRAPFRQYPKPPWFVTHRNANTALWRFAEFEADPGVLRALAVVGASLRG